VPDAHGLALQLNADGMKRRLPDVLYFVNCRLVPISRVGATVNTSSSTVWKPHNFGIGVHQMNCDRVRVTVFQFRIAGRYARFNYAHRLILKQKLVGVEDTETDRLRA
jgi:hypothetical protein